MRMFVSAALCLLWAGAASGYGQTGSAQAPAAQAAAMQAPAGLETPWEARKILSDLTAQSNQLKPLLAQLNPQEWVNRAGASSTYILQWQTAQRQANEAVASTQALSQKPDSLTAGLDTYFRLEALEVSTRSLAEGVQRYGERAIADKLNTFVAQSFSSRERLRDYLQDLAQSSEQNCKIADEEAQRCRAMISKESPQSAKKSKKH